MGYLATLFSDTELEAKFRRNFDPAIGKLSRFGASCLILVPDQLNAQKSYFKISLLYSSTCFEQRCAHHQEVKIVLYSIWYRHTL